MEPRVIFEDSEILVIEKPAGMVVNRAETTKGQETVQDWIEQKLKTQSANLKTTTQNSKIEETDFYKRAGIVHRLDKETSGLLLIAKTPQVFEDLQKQFKERKVKKTYLALVHGGVKPEAGEIRVPVGRLPWDRKKFGVLAGGREAVTKYKVITNYTLNAIPYTLVEVYPETGRTHQIRVHLKYAGYPIFSDSFYAGRKTAREDRKILPRIFLHAAKISFTHPKTEELLSFQSELPEELEEFMKNLKSAREKQN